MTAVVQRGYGSPEVLHLEQVAVPSPEAGHVLIRVAAAGLDRGVWHVMAGLPYLVRPMFGMSTPRQPIPGVDVAGTVVGLGPDTDGFAIGDRVFGSAVGSFAEYAVANASSLAAMPEGLSFDEAAAIPVSGLTAIEAVHTHGRVQSGQRVLVTGASGGVGSYAVQLAAAAGAEVTGVASGAKADFVLSLGAVRSIDYTTTNVTDLPDRYDLIVDVNGRLPLGRLIRTLTPTGALVIVGGEDGGRLTGGIQRQFGARLRSAFTRRRLGFFITSEERADLLEVARMVESGALRSTLTTVCPLDEVRQAITDLEAGIVRGKAVLRIAD
ncbi:NAD(P)-dependent alcohol dehydrogenase [Microbacterium schleiferi]|uniref:NAD(P)-dependent alcohol dehydrogenase n=2 Tax=Microbacterium schleiferi TaxID=69362 RepID=A0A7S8MZL1_9MICO|nr:NAD(P)-dependent alcohol dehydrogenase [Microbacterium schleiferi]